MKQHEEEYDQKYQELTKRAFDIFVEMQSIVKVIKHEFIKNKEYDSRLTIEIINYSLETLASEVNSFESYLKRGSSNWSTYRYTDYANQSICSFFRKFENPYLGRRDIYQQIEQLERNLVDVSIEFDKMLAELKSNK